MREMSAEPIAMKKLLAAVFSSIGELATWLESDPAILSNMPSEMFSGIGRLSAIALEDVAPNLDYGE